MFQKNWVASISQSITKKATEIPHIAIPSVDEWWRVGFLRVPYFLGVNSVNAPAGYYPLTAFCTPSGLYEWFPAAPVPGSFR